MRIGKGTTNMRNLVFTQIMLSCRVGDTLELLPPDHHANSCVHPHPGRITRATKGDKNAQIIANAQTNASALVQSQPMRKSVNGVDAII